TVCCPKRGGKMKWELKQKLSPLKKGPLTRDHLKAYAAASGDNNPIHLNEKFAQEAGFPSVIVHGMLSMAIMADGLRFNFPENAFTVNRLKGRFRKVTFPGDILSVEGE